MSETQKLSKSQRKKQKKAEKRKASGSLEDSTHSHDGSNVHNTNTCSAGGASAVGTQKNVNRIDQDKSDCERFVQSVMSFNPSPMMNLNQQVPYGYQTPQHQAHQNLTPGLFTSTPMTVNTSPPDWAIQLIDDVKTIKAALPKIDAIERTIRNMDLKITSIESKVTTLESKVQEVEQSASFISSECENQKTALKGANIEIGKLKQMCGEMQSKVAECQQRDDRATDKLLDLEARSMRDNLIFYGLPEVTSGQQGTEDCERLVKDLITTKLQLDASGIVLDRAHRLGGAGSRKPRPVVAKFHRYTDREMVRLKSQEAATKNELRGSNQGVGIQSPQPYREARKALSEHAERERNRGQRVRITGNKLFVNNKPTKKCVDGRVIDL